MLDVGCWLIIFSYFLSGATSTGRTDLPELGNLCSELRIRLPFARVRRRRRRHRQRNKLVTKQKHAKETDRKKKIIKELILITLECDDNGARKEKNGKDARCAAL